MARALPRTPIEPGGSGLARLALEAPLVARGGDRVVLRSYSPVTTIGGGIVLDPVPPLRRAAWPAELRSPDVQVRLQALLARRPAGIHEQALPQLSGLPPRSAAACAQETPGTRRAGGIWVLDRTVGELSARALELVRRFHRARPAERGLPLETLRRSLRAPAPVVEAVVQRVHFNLSVAPGAAQGSMLPVTPSLTSTCIVCSSIAATRSVHVRSRRQSPMMASRF